MNTQSLIDQLAAEAQPIEPRTMEGVITRAVIIGSFAALVGTVALFGVQPNLAAPARMLPFLLKVGFAFAIAAVALPMLIDVARPGVAIERRQWRQFGWPLGVLAVIAAVQAAATAPVDWPRLIMGASWAWCPLRITVLSLPAQAAIGWAMRRQAPTDLRLAGALTGLLSGSLSTIAYALSCTETAAGFVLLWYTTGIALSTAIGALTGPKFLRW